MCPQSWVSLSRARFEAPAWVERATRPFRPATRRTEQDGSWTVGLASNFQLTHTSVPLGRLPSKTGESPVPPGKSLRMGIF
jgi:hypothetical protein